MCGLYELAIQYSYDFINEIDSVHLGIALNYYGLLKVSSNINKDELIYLNPVVNEYEVNFLRFIGSFTRTFKISDPKVACQYLILISMSKGGDSKEEINQCHEALRELILVSREFNLLLGQLDVNNGEKTSGLLEVQRNLIMLNDLQDFYYQIIELSAKKCEDEGRVFDSLLLYQLCQQYDTVLSIINKILSELISTTELDKSLIKSGNYENVDGEEGSKVDTVENNIVLLSRHVVNTFNNNSNILTKLDASSKKSCDLLLAIVNIRESFLEKNFNQVLLDIGNLNLVPINPKADMIQIRDMARYVSSSLDDTILKVIPSLLVIIMTSISQIVHQVMTKTFKSLVNENEEIDRLKAMAKNAMIFAGIVQYNMPRETYSLLIQLESQL
jgi:nuclear pore complex protein Nup93